MSTCDHGAEDHSDGHLVALREQVEEVVLDGDGPPREVEDDRRKRECQQLALSRRQFKIETCQNMKKQRELCIKRKQLCKTDIFINGAMLGQK